MEQFVEVRPITAMKWEVTMQLSEANLGRLAGISAQLVSDWELLHKGMGTPALICALLLTIRKNERLAVDEPNN